jgi:transposase
MTPAAAAILDGMPDPKDLHRVTADGTTWILAGPVALFCYPEDDARMRNIAVVTLRQLGYCGQDVAELMGLSENYVATLRNRALRQGTAGVVRQPGARSKLGQADWDRARSWRQAGTSDAQIARRLGVHQTTVTRRLGTRDTQQELPQPEPEHAPGTDLVRAPGTDLVPAPGAGPQASEPVYCRYAGAMLLHAYASHCGAGDILACAAADRDGFRYADVALLAVTSICFALGAATTEQFKHLTASCAGPLAGLAVLPDLRTLRPRLAAIADASDPLELQAMFAAAMLAADPVLSGVYYVDDHFVPYTGAKPVGKGWNNKRGTAERGRADTHVTAHDGRAVCFVTGEPSGLTVTLPLALAELKKAVPAGAAIMLGFDRGGAYPQVFRHCREQEVHWVTYRRAPLAVPAGLPVLSVITVNGRRREVAWAEETVTIKDYGAARQITLSEHGQAALQILTSDTGACPAEILAWLKSRWREENFLKYASQNYGIDKICDYAAAIQANTKMIANPARKAASTAVHRAEKNLAAAREQMAIMLADPAIPAPAKNATLIPAARTSISRAERTLTRARAARDKIPAKLPANQIDPQARTALLRTGRRGLQMILRLLAHNAEHWLSSHLNAYLRDDREYRAITRQTIIRGLAGTITHAPAAITVTLQQPDEPRVARALALLLDEINATPPAMPGDTRPITYQLAAGT